MLMYVQCHHPRCNPGRVGVLFFVVRFASMATGPGIYTCTFLTDGLYIRLLRANVHLRGGIAQLAMFP